MAKVWAGVISLMVLFCFNAGAVTAQSIFEYQTYYEFQGERVKSSNPVDSFSIEIGDLKDNVRIVKWSKQEGKEYNIETYLLDKEWATIEWDVEDSKDSLRYSAVREGNTLIIDGEIKNNRIKKEISIDEAPFYYNPKLGLRYLVNSENQDMFFWAMRHDNLDIFKMKALKKGKETIKVNGIDVEAVRVDWAATDGLSKYFTRTYWFRSSDGNFIKQKVSGTKVRGLVNER
ncbi:MAG: hypothetical protein AB7S78_11030 [Candidatus Omnitrophota bacterium]